MFPFEERKYQSQSFRRDWKVSIFQTCKPEAGNNKPLFKRNEETGEWHVDQQNSASNEDSYWSKGSYYNNEITTYNNMGHKTEPCAQ